MAEPRTADVLLNWNVCDPYAQACRAARSTNQPTRAGHQILQVQEVVYLGLTDGALAQPLFKLAIRPGYAVMLTKVFRPGTHDECLDIPVGDLQVSANPPSRRAVAAPDASVFAHGLDKL